MTVGTNFNWVNNSIQAQDGWTRMSMSSVLTLKNSYTKWSPRPTLTPGYLVARNVDEHWGELVTCYKEYISYPSKVSGKQIVLVQDKWTKNLTKCIFCHFKLIISSLSSHTKSLANVLK